MTVRSRWRELRVTVPTVRLNITLALRFAKRGKAWCKDQWKSGAFFARESVCREAGFEVYYCTVEFEIGFTPEHLMIDYCWLISRYTSTIMASWSNFFTDSDSSPSTRRMMANDGRLPPMTPLRSKIPQRILLLRKSQRRCNTSSRLNPSCSGTKRTTASETTSLHW